MGLTQLSMAGDRKGNSLMSHTAVDALGDVTMMRARLSWAMDELNLKHSESQQWLSHLHFAKLPLSGLSDVGANFVPYLVSAAVSREQSNVMRSFMSGVAHVVH